MDDIELVKIILAQINNRILDVKDKDGKTALYYATELLYGLENGFLIITALLKHNANPNIQDNRGNTPLLIGFKKSLYDKDALNLLHLFLIDSRWIKPDLALANDRKETLLTIAQKLSFKETAKALREAGAK